MKLVIQIPCLNEEATLPATVRDLPRRLEGVDSIEVLVIDDGSSDRTSAVARELGIHRVVRFPDQRGLARAFERGLQESLAMGADIIVNTDADNQYAGKDIGRLIGPILAGDAEMVVGARPISDIEHFSRFKKLLQKAGSRVVRALSNTDVPDATSGFRAYSRTAALRLTVMTNFTYTLETLIQAAQKNIAVTHVPVRVNAQTRPSRLFRGIRVYLQRSFGTMVRVYVMYQPLKFFFAISAVFLAGSLVLFTRFAYFALTVHGQTGHMQSVAVAGALAVIGFLLGALGVLSDLIATNRRLLEEILVHARSASMRRGPEEGRGW